MTDDIDARTWVDRRQRDILHLADVKYCQGQGDGTVTLWMDRKNFRSEGLIQQWMADDRVYQGRLVVKMLEEGEILPR